MLIQVGIVPKCRYCIVYCENLIVNFVFVKWSGTLFCLFIVVMGTQMVM